MKPKTEEFLYFLLWSAEALFRPTFRNLNESYEGWAYRNGLLRQIAVLEEQQWIERGSPLTEDRLYRLTEQGRLHALGGRDPEARWMRRWDGQWRLILFDVPIGQNARRERLRRYLRTRAFGCLQGSVWVSPDPMQSEREILEGGKVDVGSLLLLEARPCSGENDEEIVAGAWDFEKINERYTAHMEILNKRPADPLRDDASAEVLRRWAAAEREAWFAAVNQDPLLPECLLPRDYLGRKAWRLRKNVLARAGRQMRNFRA